MCARREFGSVVISVRTRSDRALVGMKPATAKMPPKGACGSGVLKRLDKSTVTMTQLKVFLLAVLWLASQQVLAQHWQRVKVADRPLAALNGQTFRGLRLCGTQLRYCAHPDQ